MTVSFPLEEDPDVSLVAWTTTPWTLPSNLALCVNPELQYVKLRGKCGTPLPSGPVDMYLCFVFYTGLCEIYRTFLG